RRNEIRGYHVDHRETPYGRLVDGGIPGAAGRGAAAWASEARTRSGWLGSGAIESSRDPAARAGSTVSPAVAAARARCSAARTTPSVIPRAASAVAIAIDDEDATTSRSGLRRRSRAGLP